MFEGICVGGWDRGVGEVVVFSMGTRLLTAAIETKSGKKSYRNMRIRSQSQVNCNKKMTLPAMMSSSVSVSVCAGVATMSPSGAC